MKPHGSWYIAWQDDLMTIDLEGSFNKEGVLQLQHDIRSEVLRKKMTEWARLEIFHVDTLATPDAVHAVEQFSPWYALNGCVAFGAVCNDSVQKTLLKKVYRDGVYIYNDTNVAVQSLQGIRHPRRYG
ncbi:hypothetical protein ACFSJY_02375 [Thalassotalea euphylliae]|uniref:hypothetical protein n=1 Tax=Thalassotalea euphylliae TaxID=1655234 RepID=UPI00363002DC